VKAAIRSVGSYVPQNVMTNDDLAKTIDTSDEWIVSHTGIRRRHLAAPDEATSDLACFAAERALRKADLPASKIDLILVATSTPDFNGFPSTACLVQHRLGAHRAAAMDLTAACTGFVYALETASAFVRAGSAHNVLVIGSEAFSRIVDWSDRNTCVLFGDGAGAVVVTEHDGERGIVRSFLRSEGGGAEYLWVPAGGSRTPYVPGTTARSDLCVQMNGRQIYNFAIRAIGETVDALLGDSLTLDDIAYIIPHQANERIIEAAAKRLSLPIEKFFTNIAEYANTSAASIPLALDDMEERHLLSLGDLIITIGFGGGLTYGGNLIRW
jgi:3-oxoacyl-[acyl-carrier-protein] synthase III